MRLSRHVELVKKFGSTALQIAAGYESDEMDALLVELAGAATDEAKIESIGRIQDRPTRTRPARCGRTAIAREMRTASSAL